MEPTKVFGISMEPVTRCGLSLAKRLAVHFQICGEPRKQQKPYIIWPFHVEYYGKRKGGDVGIDMRHWGIVSDYCKWLNKTIKCYRDIIQTKPTTKSQPSTTRQTQTEGNTNTRDGGQSQDWASFEGYHIPDVHLGKYAHRANSEVWSGLGKV